MSQLTTNTTTIDECIALANSLPDAGSGGGGTVETCSFSATYPISFTVIYTTGSGEPAWTAGYDETVTVEVMKNTLVTFWTDSGRCGYSCTGDVSLFYGNDSFGPVVLHVTGDGTFTPYLD